VVDSGPEVVQSGTAGVDSGPEWVDSGPEGVDSGPEVRGFFPNNRQHANPTPPRHKRYNRFTSLRPSKPTQGSPFTFSNQTTPFQPRVIVSRKSAGGNVPSVAESLPGPKDAAVMEYQDV
jgi:hypothetical protein